MQCSSNSRTGNDRACPSVYLDELGAPTACHDQSRPQLVIGPLHRSVEASRHPGNLRPSMWVLAHTARHIEHVNIPFTARHGRAYLSCLSACEVCENDGLKQLRRGKHSRDCHRAFRTALRR